MILFEVVLRQFIVVIPALTSLSHYLPGLHYLEFGFALAVFLVQISRKIPGFKQRSFESKRWPVIIILSIFGLAFIPLPGNPEIAVSKETGDFIVPPPQFPGDYLIRGDLGADFGRRKGWISDNFISDKSLNSNLWTTDTPLLASIAQRFDSKLVKVSILHTSSGIAISGVDDRNQFTGIQSKVRFSIPLALEAAVDGTKANGNSFEIYLINEDLSQYLRISGNLNKRNRPYYGVWVSSTTPGLTLEHSQSQILYNEPEESTWYIVRILVEPRGYVGVALLNRDGVAVGLKRDSYLGTGPFYLIFGQREGAPFIAGPNEAIWSWFRLTSDKAFPDEIPPPPPK